MSEVHEQFGGDLRILLANRLGMASVVEVFSDKEDMSLSLTQEPDGRQFVSRVYETGGERQFDDGLHTPGLGFEEGLAAMEDMFRDVGLRVVPSSVLPRAKGEPFTVVSEYIPGLLTYAEATLEAKQEAVTGLAKMLDPKFPYLPGVGGIAIDMFMYATDENGDQHPIVVDNEPRLVVKDAFRGHKAWIDSTRAMFINGIATRIEAGWGKDSDEMAALARAFLAGLGTIRDESIHEGEATLEAIMSLHAFTQPELMGIRKILGR